MKTKYTYLLLYVPLMAIVAVSCGEQPKETVQEEPIELIEEPAAEQEEVLEPIVPADAPVIDGCYATNTNHSVTHNSALNAVDGDPSTAWETPVGSGLYEGIMLYFLSPVTISNVSVDFKQGPSYYENVTYNVVSDGRSYSGGVAIFSDVNALFVRFSPPTSSTSEKDGDHKSLHQSTFDVSKSLGVQEIKCYDFDGEPIDFVIPKVVNGQITASSTLSPEASYAPAFLVDGKFDFAWAEGAESKGVNEEVRIELDEEISIDRIRIWNGYQRSDKHYDDNARLSSFTLLAANAEEVGQFLIPDQKETSIEVPKTKTNTLNLKVDEVFEGAKYEDLVVSELRFYYRGRPYLIQTNHEKNVMQANQEEANTLLSSFLDKTYAIRTHEEVEADYMVSSSTTSNTFILRSNGSFVYYGEEAFYEMENEDPMPFSEDQNTIIADGGWELIEQNEDEVKVRIFGKRYMLTTDEQLYKSKVDQSTLRVFQDYVTLSKTEIKSNSTFATMKVLW